MGKQMMGKQMMRMWRLGSLLVLALALAGCSDDVQPPKPDAMPDAMPDASPDMWDDFGPNPDGTIPCKLTISSINGRAKSTVTELTAADDQSSTAPGLQIEVEVTGTGLADGTDVGLNVTKLSPDPSQKAAGSKTTFKDVDLDSNLTSVVIKAYAKGCSTDTLALPVKPPPDCYFDKPKDGETVTQLVNDIDVVAINAMGGDVDLRIGSSLQGTVKVSATGKVTFSGINLGEGLNNLQADVRLGNIKRSCTAKVTAVTGAPTCTIGGFTPAAITITKSPGKGLGIAQDASASTTGLQTTVTVTSSGTSVALTVGASAPVTQTVSGGTATFNALSIPDGNTTLVAKCSSSDTGKSATSPTEQVWVDSTEPGAVADLDCKVTNNRGGEVTCTWTAVSDPGGTAASGMAPYEVRHVAGANLTAANWATATKLPDVSALAPGATQTVVVKDLPLATLYAFGVMPKDNVMNESSTGPFAFKQLSVDFDKGTRDGVTGAKAWGSILAAGDYNCDGFTDVAVGAPQDQSGNGRVYIYLGTSLGLTAAPWKIFSGTVASSNFGAALMTLKSFDKDADGCNDLAVLASHGGASNKGRVFIYLGRKTNFFDREDVTTGLGAELILALPGTAGTTELLGEGLGAGDFDGDGATDLLLSHANTATGTDTASVLVIYGDSTLTLMKTGTAPKTSLLPAAAGVAISGGKFSDGFGSVMAGGGKLDADSYDDVVIAAPSTGTSGAVYVVKGGARASSLPESLPLTDTRVIKIAGGAANATFGASVAFVGDMDNDLKNEFAVGDPGFSSSLGTVYIFNLAGTTAPSGVADAVATVTNDVTGASGDKFGLALACAAGLAPTSADLDKNSYADLLVSSETMGSAGVGAVFMIGGATSLAGLASSKADYTFSPTGTTSYGAPVVLAKDIDGDGYVDVIVGDPGYSSGLGRFFFYH